MMSSMEYDIDVTGGVMPEIQALVCPPNGESFKRPKKEARFRRPGRTVNHDSCDSCKEGGDLICCDRCPAAFHLQCYDPPINEQDVPLGEWVCHKCMMMEEEEEEYTSDEEEDEARSDDLQNNEEGQLEREEGLLVEEGGQVVEEEESYFEDEEQIDEGQIEEGLYDEGPIEGGGECEAGQIERDKKFDNGQIEGEYEEGEQFGVEGGIIKDQVVEHTEQIEEEGRMDVEEGRIRENIQTEQDQIGENKQTEQDQIGENTQTEQGQIRENTQTGQGQIGGNTQTEQNQIVENIQTGQGQIAEERRNEEAPTEGNEGLIEDRIEEQVQIMEEKQIEEGHTVQEVQIGEEADRISEEDQTKVDVQVYVDGRIEGDVQVDDGDEEDGQFEENEEELEEDCENGEFEGDEDMELEGEEYLEGDEEEIEGDEYEDELDDEDDEIDEEEDEEDEEECEEGRVGYDDEEEGMDFNGDSEYDQEEEEADGDDEEEDDDGYNSTTGLHLLVKAATSDNPGQFQVHQKLHGSAAPSGSKNKRSRTREHRIHKRQAIEQDNTILPLPTKLCQVCEKSCQEEPLVQCDFCEMMYHPNCMEPPLTLLPSETWMCHNHKDHVVEVDQRESSSAVSRVRLWSKFSVPSANQDLVKAKFFKKLHRENPLFSYRSSLSHKPTVRVPNAIKQQYKCGLPLLPRPTESPPSFQHTSAASSTPVLTPEEQEEWLSNVVGFQVGMVKYFAQKNLSKSPADPPSTTAATCNPSSATTKYTDSIKLPISSTSEDNKVMVNGGSILLLPDSKFAKPPGKVNGEVDHSLEVKMEGGDTLNWTPRTKPSAIRLSNGNKVALINTNPISPRIVTLQAPGGKPVSTKVSVATSLGSSPAIVNLNHNLQACIEGASEVELNKLDERLVRILAWQRLQQLLPAKNTPATKKTLNGYSSGAAASTAQARAIICPLTGKGISIPMPYRKLTIGMGADMDVCLNNYGHCNFISAKHACIFYDELTNHYELLNYSEHGTTVDNVLYSCDFSEKPPPASPASPLAASLRKLVGTAPSPASKYSSVAPRPSQIWKPCSCKVSSSCLIGGSGAGWEGTAILHHGSYIKCGCLQFVFSIVEHAKPEFTLLPSSQTSSCST